MVSSGAGTPPAQLLLIGTRFDHSDSTCSSKSENQNQMNSPPFEPTRTKLKSETVSSVYYGQVLWLNSSFRYVFRLSWSMPKLVLCTDRINSHVTVIQHCRHARSHMRLVLHLQQLFKGLPQRYAAAAKRNGLCGST